MTNTENNMRKLDNTNKIIPTQPVNQNELHHVWMEEELYEERQIQAPKLDKVRLLGLCWQKLYLARRKDSIDEC